MIRVVLPPLLQDLARVKREVSIYVTDPVTIGALLDALEASYPMLCGTIRDQATKKRRPFIRFFACGEDLSHESLGTLLPAEVVAGKEPLRVVGAIAGG